MSNFSFLAAAKQIIFRTPLLAASGESTVANDIAYFMWKENWQSLY